MNKEYVLEYLKTKEKEKSEIWAGSHVEKIDAEAKLEKLKKDFTPEELADFERVTISLIGKDQKGATRVMQKLDEKTRENFQKVAPQKDLEETIRLAERRIKSQEGYLVAIDKFKKSL